MVRSASNIAVQIGVESTPGTAVAANKRLMGLNLTPHATFETIQHRPSGYKVPTASSVSVEKTEADYDGPIDYKNIIYPLASLFGSPVSTQPDAVDAPTVYEHTWTFTGKGAINPKTFTVEVGDSSRANVFNYGAFSSLDLSVNRTGDNEMSGSMIGRSMTTGGTLTASPTEVDIMPVNGDHWDVYADPDSADIGDTKLLSLYEAGVSFSDMLSEEFTVNSAYGSFTSLYDSEEPSLNWNMTVGADAVAEAYFDRLRNGGRTFIRLQATGPVIEDTQTFGIEIDMCVIVTDFDSYESNDGIYVLPINFSLAYDPVWQKSMQITVRNNLASL